MKRPWVLDGVKTHTVQTERIRANVLETDGIGMPVVLIHGKCSSAHLYQETMQLVPGRTIAIDLRGFGDSEALPVDATRGLADFSDDVASVLAAMGVTRAIIVGWSMGGGVAMQLALDYPALVAGLVLESPVPPVGFGGTDIEGALISETGAGTGAGGANPDFVARLAAGDVSDDAQTSPRRVFQNAYVAAGYESEKIDLWVASMLSTATGDDNYPGDSIETSAWPGFAPGTRGVLNAMSPVHMDLSALVDLEVKPPVLWVRGELDAIVGDASFFDVNMRGEAGVIPDWPGRDVAPPQPMVKATRRLFERYSAAGGSVREVVWDGVGHSPHLERPAEFAALVDEFRAAVIG